MPLSSFVPGADGSEFPLENLPYGVFSHAQSGRDPRCGVAIGDYVLDLRALAAEGLLDDAVSGLSAESIFGGSTLNAFMGCEAARWRAVRSRLTALLTRGGADALPEALHPKLLVPRSEATMHLPAAIGDYTDFYSSREHATNVGIMFRGKDNALQPNWLHLPVGYHGRASSVVVSGTPVVRPKGQLQLDKADPTKGTEHAACRLLDFELEMGFFVGGPPNPLGRPVTMEEAPDRIFGFVLCNDWSARDVQKFEYVPLGPFGAKNFATTISPWVVPTLALEPFACATSAGEQTAPAPLPYLADPAYASYDVALAVEITPKDGAAPTVVSRSNYRHMYWTCKQQLVHHSVTGCDMCPGDLLASGTISGADETAYGSMLELSWQGTKEIGPLSDGTTRKFLKDGDTVGIRGVCQGDGFKIGFGECVGRVLSAGSTPPSPLPPPPACALGEATLHSYWRSSCSWRVRIALAHYGVPYAYKAVNLLKGEQSGVSPMGQVPRLDWTDGGGARRSLTQSMAIIELLCDACDSPASARASLRPSDPVARARSRQIAEVIGAGTQPLQNLSVIKAMGGAMGSDEAARAWAKGMIEKGLVAVEQLLSPDGPHADGSAGSSGGPFCVGARLSIADVFLVPQLYNARRFDIDLAPYPRCLAIEANLETLDAFKRAHPDAQPDAVAAAPPPKKQK